MCKEAFDPGLLLKELSDKVQEELKSNYKNVKKLRSTLKSTNVDWDVHFSTTKNENKRIKHAALEIHRFFSV